MPKQLYFLSILFFLCVSNAQAQLPKGFLYVSDEIPSIVVELRYFGTYNFVGTKIDGYEAEKCVLSAEATKALKKVQAALNKQGLGLKIYDAYRPQRAVHHFIRWAKNVNDTLMKAQFYPNVDKKELFRRGYIASKSRHSSGSTLDITIIDLHTKNELDMGSSYDFFGKISWTAFEKLTETQLKNRALLQKVMATYGFRNYPKEWWHFTLRGEPYLNQYFDFPIR